MGCLPKARRQSCGIGEPPAANVRRVGQRRRASCAYEPAGRQGRGANARGIRLDCRTPSRIIESIGHTSKQGVPGEAPRFTDLAHFFTSTKIIDQAACSTGSADGAASICERSFGQSIKRRRPFISSTSEVQLSTQSPSLQ
jgi:hypothetical protein